LGESRTRFRSLSENLPGPCHVTGRSIGVSAATGQIRARSTRMDRAHRR